MARRVIRAAAVLVALALCVSPARAQLVGRTSIERRIAELARPETEVRISAATALGVTGPTARVAPALARALEGETAPEVRHALIASLARRGDVESVPALVAAWERASTPDREHVLDGLAAIATPEALSFVAERLASELHATDACDRLGRAGEPGLDAIAMRLGPPEGRDGAVLCLVQLADRPRAASLLVELMPSLTFAMAARALTALEADPRILAAAVQGAESTEAMLAEASLAVLARRAPERIPVARWRELAGRTDVRAASAVVALTVLDPAFADPVIALVAEGGGPRASELLRALMALPEPEAHRIAAFVAHPGTQVAALDALVRLRAIDALTALPPSPHVAVALAIALAGAPDASERLRVPTASLDASVRLVALAIAGAVDASACVSGEGLRDRRRAAYCLYRARDGAARAAAALETERDPSVVPWLVLASDRAPSDEAITALSANDRTRVAILSRLPEAIARSAPTARRRYASMLVLAARSEAERERAVAIEALGRLGTADHRAQIAAALDDPSASVRLAAARASTRLPPDTLSELRRLGRARIEHDPIVRAALLGEALPASMPMHVRVDVQGDDEVDAPVELLLADGRLLALAPVDGELVLFDVPGGTARARLLDPERD